MVQVIVTRGGQVTLAKAVRTKLGIREGDVVQINTIGHTAIISRRDPRALEKHNFLPESFSKTLQQIRKVPVEERLKRLGILV